MNEREQELERPRPVLDFPKRVHLILQPFLAGLLFLLGVYHLRQHQMWAIVDFALSLLLLLRAWHRSGKVD
jgi:hypothetical protein